MSRLPYLVLQDAALQQDRSDDGHAQQPDDQQRLSPADKRHQERRHRRAGREAQIAAERM
jgi:hypothetical protein